MWWSFTRLWPKAKRQVTYAALLFAIYPIFIQQPIAVAYQRHWLAYAAYLFSIGAIMSVVRQPKHYWLFTVLSILTLLVHLSTLEYFVGLELLRPVILWVALIDKENTLLEEFPSGIYQVAAYLVILAAFSIWRIVASLQVGIQFEGAMPADSNPPALLFDLFAKPVATLIHLVQMVLQDSIHIFATSWYSTLNPQAINLTRPFTVFSWGMVVITALDRHHLSPRLKTDDRSKSQEAQAENPQTNWPLQAFVTGLCATLFGMLPVWVIYQQVSIPGNNTDRFGLAAMFGASLVIVATLEWLLKKRRSVLVIGVLVGLAVGMHLRIANEYEYSWTKQERVYWQLYWRAPAVTPSTNFLSDRDLFSFVRPAFSFNLLYLQPRDTRQLAYNFFLIPEGIASGSPSWLDGIQIETHYREFSYSASSKDSLVIFYEPPETTNCLWVMQPDDEYNPHLTARMIDALPISNLDLHSGYTFPRSIPVQRNFRFRTSS